jgi:predicted amidohydrolase
MGQMLVEMGEAERNLQRAAGMIRQAAASGCRILVLPECLDLGWTFPDAARVAQPIPGPHSDQLCAAAREAGIFVVAGLTESDGGRVYNAAVLISEQGQVLLKHRKINELDIGREIYHPGRSLAVAETPLGAIGVTICADNFPDSLALGHAIARMGAHILLSPCAWAVEANHDNTRTPYGDLWRNSYTKLAGLYEMPVVGVSNVGWLTAGPWKGRKCIGCSVAVGPEGEILSQGPYGEQAEALIPVCLTLRDRPAPGTAFADWLRARGREPVSP